MKMDKGPLAYSSCHAPFPLTEDEEATLVFAACGITGHALADLPFAQGQGGTIMAGLLGRTVASGDAIQTVALIVTNDEATYLIKRPQDFTQAEIPELIDRLIKESGSNSTAVAESRLKMAGPLRLWRRCSISTSINGLSTRREPLIFCPSMS